MIDHLSGSKCHHVLAKACKLRSHAFSLFATFRVKLLQNTLSFQAAQSRLPGGLVKKMATRFN